MDDEGRGRKVEDEVSEVVNAGLSFSSSVWILVRLLGTGGQLAYPGLRNLKRKERWRTSTQHFLILLYVCSPTPDPRVQFP